jgi:hypothetical protein
MLPPDGKFDLKKFRAFFNDFNGNGEKLLRSQEYKISRLSGFLKNNRKTLRRIIASHGLLGQGQEWLESFEKKCGNLYKMSLCHQLNPDPIYAIIGKAYSSASKQLLESGRITESRLSLFPLPELKNEIGRELELLSSSMKRIRKDARGIIGLGD